ncbi:hypothetical protein HDU76_007007, partial [Blyttiomyces sp. JEL0837]
MLGSKDWTVQHSKLLCDWLKDGSRNGNETGRDAKKDIPQLRDFSANVLNGKLKSFRSKIRKDPDYDPEDEVMPMIVGASKKRSHDDVDTDSDDDDDGPAKPPKSAKPPCTTPGAMQTLFVSLTPFSPPKSRVADPSVYNKAQVKEQKVTTDLRLHEMVRYKNKNDIYQVDVMIRVICDMELDYAVEKSGLNLICTYTPCNKEPDDFMASEDTKSPRNQAITAYYFDTPKEKFTYNIPFPEPVDSSAVDNWTILRDVWVNDSNGKM